MGAFQTDELLNQKKEKEVIDKELGSMRIKMLIQAKNTENNHYEDDRGKKNSSKLNAISEVDEQKKTVESS